MEHIPQNIRREQTQKKIITAAKELFSQCDYFQTNSKDISKAAGVSIGSFYTYFDNKKEVMIEILNEYMNETLNSSFINEGKFSEETSDLIYSLKSIVRTCFTMHTFPLGFYKNVTILSIMDEEIKLLFNNYEQTITSRLKKILIKQDPNLSDAKIESTCIILYSAVKGSIHQIKFQDNNLEEHILIEELVSFLHSYILSLSVLPSK